jgi:membrane-anchored glycerophosphoryl diester phosphodiesterase (GDPDase)
MSFMLGFAVVLAVGIAVGVLVVGIVVFDAPLGAAVVVGVGLAAILGVLLIWFWVRVRALAVPTLMLEPVGIFGALRRAVRLTSHQFWRLLGLLLLVTLVTGVAGGILRLPFSITGQVFLASADETGYGLVIYLLMTAIGTVISSAVLQPFSAAVSALLYIDQRMRKEAYDVELLTRAGILPA